MILVCIFYFKNMKLKMLIFYVVFIYNIFLVLSLKCLILMFFFCNFESNKIKEVDDFFEKCIVFLKFLI